MTPTREEREYLRRTIADQGLDVDSLGADGRECDGLFVKCAGWTAAGRTGGGGAG